jgi:hypothetical protein
MAESTTAVYHFIKPDIGGSKETWGNRLNKDLDDLDTFLAGQNEAQWYGLQRGDSTAIVKQYDPAGNVLGTLSLTDPHFRTAANILLYTKAMTDTISGPNHDTGGTTEFFQKPDPGTLVPQQLLYRALDLLMPVGTIIQWHGTEATIPAGWKMCGPAVPNFQIEGGGGATIDIPDWRGRLVMAAYRSNEGPATMRPGMTSGTAGTFGHGHTGTVGLHTLIADELPPHVHGSSMTDNERFIEYTKNDPDYWIGSHTTASNNYLKLGTIAPIYAGSASSPGGSDGVTAGHSHDLTINANTVPDSPFIAAVFIIKVRRWETWVP